MIKNTFTDLFAFSAWRFYPDKRPTGADSAFGNATSASRILKQAHPANAGMSGYCV